MAPVITTAEFDTALAEVAAENAVWFATYRSNLAERAAQRRREVEASILAVNAIGRYLDGFAVDSGAFGG